MQVGLSFPLVAENDGSHEIFMLLSNSKLKRTFAQLVLVLPGISLGMKREILRVNHSDRKFGGS